MPQIGQPPSSNAPTSHVAKSLKPARRPDDARSASLKDALTATAANANSPRLHAHLADLSTRLPRKQIRKSTNALGESGQGLADFAFGTVALPSTRQPGLLSPLNRLTPNIDGAPRAATGYRERLSG